MKDFIIGVLICALLYVGFLLYQLKTEATQDIRILKEDIKETYTHINSFYYLLNQIPLGAPLDSIKITSKYGWRRRKKHKGIDLDGTYKDTVYVTGDGVVEKAGWMFGYGRCVIVDHLNGYTTVYAHLRRLFVGKDEILCKDQAIGTIGNTGFSTGSHLHYEIRHMDKHKDPYSFIFFDKEN